jgi:hypothetical protein
VSDEIKTHVKAGKLFCFAEGEYSDYGYVGHFLALEDITSATFEKCKERCMERIKAGEGESYGMPPDIDDPSDVAHALRGLFLPELTRMGVLMDIECVEIHLASYGRLLV